MKSVKFLLPLFALTLFTLASCGNDNKPKDPVKAADNANEMKTETNKSEEDAQALVNAADTDMKEIAAAQLAMTMATNASVKEFAAMMVQAHNMMSSETKALAAKKNYTLPAAMSNDFMEDVEDMKKWAKGKEFDTKYADEMVDSHQKALDMLEKRAAATQDNDVKMWATKGAAEVRKHLEMANALDTKMEEMYKK